MKATISFNYIVRGKHNFLKKVNRKCITLSEAENVKKGLESVDYIVKIEKLN